VETDSNWQDNEADNVERGVCVPAGYWDALFDGKQHLGLT